MGKLQPAALCMLAVLISPFFPLISVYLMIHPGMNIFIWILGLISLGGAPPSLFISQSGQVNFSSEAPLELIKASSQQLRGVLDTENNTFAFLIPMNSFEGFNDPLQKEHFCEKFLACKRFPQASFEGKIIESISYDEPGVYQVRAKGEFIIHGISQERIIKAQISIADDKLEIRSQFSVKLADHKIKVPQIVYLKVAEIIQVDIFVSLLPKKP